ncbi:alpha/beta hydrolase [Niabella aquatica]
MKKIIILLCIPLFINWQKLPAGSTVQSKEAGCKKTVSGTEKVVIFKKAGSVALKMVIRYPAENKKCAPLPAIVFFYGGGWNSAAPDQFSGQAKYLAKEGMIAATADYRVRNDHGTTPFDALDDARSAVAYLREHANELGINPNKLAAGGGSAGGQLAAATDLTGTGLAESSAVSCRPNALVLFNPVFNNGPGNFGNNSDSRAVGDRYPEFSPYHNIKKGAAPTIVFLGTSDKLIPVSVAEDYKKAMEAAGSRCDLYLYKDQGHGFFNRAPYYNQTLEQAARFLRELGYLPAKK